MNYSELKITDLTVNSKEEGKRWCSENLSSSQLRNFFNEAKAIEMKLEVISDFKEIEPLMGLLCARSAYRRAKKTNLRRNEDPLKSLDKFIQDSLTSIKSVKEYKNFMKCFEASYGFYVSERGGE